MGNYLPWELASKNYKKRFALTEAQRREPVGKQEEHTLTSCLSYLPGAVEPYSGLAPSISRIPK